jgi:hypothetical protein
MAFAFGLNLELSGLEDVKKAKAHLDKFHSAWPELKAFVRSLRPAGKELDFGEIVMVVQRIEAEYGQYQGKDCQRAKEELVAKPSHHDGLVQLSEVQPSHVFGRRMLFADSKVELKKLGVVTKTNEVLISNYVNSQSMCLSTASYFSACCVNECEGLLARLERDVAAPAAEPSHLTNLMAELPGHHITQSLLQEIPSLVDAASGKVALHGHALAAWMHRAFPSECPDPHQHEAINPRTPDDWMSESSLNMKEIQELMAESARALSKYTSMGKEAAGPTDAPKMIEKECQCSPNGHACKCHKLPGERLRRVEDGLSDPSEDIVRIVFSTKQDIKPKRQILTSVFQLLAVCSMLVSAAFTATAGLSSSRSDVDKANFVQIDDPSRLVQQGEEMSC